MSILSWFFKSKRKMAKENTKHVKLGKYIITSHAQNRVVDPTRKTTKWDVVDNLFTKPHAVTEVKKDNKGRLSYKRIGKRITTTINPTKKKVVTLRPISDSEKKKYNIAKRREKYVKKSKLKNRQIDKRKNTRHKND